MLRKLKRYLWNWLIWIDIGFNVLFGGSPDETISSRIGKRTREDCPFCYWVCRGLHLIDPNHCEKSVKRDRGQHDIIT